MKKYLILSAFILIIFFYGCDGLLAVRGYVINDRSIKSHIVADSLFNSLHLSDGIEGAFILIDPNVQDSLFNRENIKRYGFVTFSDSIGYFEYQSTVPPGKWDAGIVVSKNGYVNDTIYFNSNTRESYWSNFVISLKKNN
ncbi:MAG: hypothetical protein IPM14_16485 [bacterium]|nr:hypothetical protein [bacterium]